MPPPALVFQTRVSWGNGSNDHLKPNSEKGFDDQNRRAVPECTFRFSVRNKFSWLRNKLDISLKINRILVSGPRFREIILFFGLFRRPNRKSETTLVHQFFILLQQSCLRFSGSASEDSLKLICIHSFLSKENTCALMNQVLKHGRAASWSA